MHWGKEEQDCRRRERRRSVDLVGLAFRGDGSRSVVSISDISFEGCRLTGGEFEMKEGIRLVIPERGEMGARVRWASKGKSGALFTNDEKLAASVPTHAAQRDQAHGFAQLRQRSRVRAQGSRRLTTRHARRAKRRS